MKYVVETRAAATETDVVALADRATEKSRTLAVIHGKLDEISSEAKGLAALTNRSSVVNLDNQRALRWIDETLEDVAATVIGLALCEGSTAG